MKHTVKHATKKHSHTESKAMQGEPSRRNTGHIQTVVIGGGQAGLSVGYHLAKLGLPFIILDANIRIGDSWRQRWDSLRLFTPAQYDGLAGMPFPAPAHYFPTKDEMAEYLESYVKRFNLPVRSGIRVDGLTKENGRFVVSAGDERFEADNVVVAMATYQKPRVPAFASALDPSITQLHSSEYRNPSQLQSGGVLVVGAGNSGAEIAIEIARVCHVWMSGRDVGHVPFDIKGVPARLFLLPLLLRVIFHRIITTNSRLGKKLRPKILTQGGPLIRINSSDLAASGIERVSRVAGVQNGKPLLDDGRVLDAANVIWCTGFDPGFSWIKLPVLGEHGPKHFRGVVESEPGLYFAGLHFLYALSSTMIYGTGRDAEYIAKHIKSRAG